MKTLINFRRIDGKTDRDSMIDTSSSELKDLACLIQYSGEDIGRPYYLQTSTVLIGRDSRADIQIVDEQTSRRHAQINVSAKLIEIDDLGSTNGTQVNGEYIDKPYPLNDGDMIRVGSVKFKYYAPGGSEKLFHDKLYRQATIDEKTGTYNNKYLQTQLTVLANKAYGSNTPLSLLMFDLDKFKSVNDTYDHLIGDFILKHTCDSVKEVLRKNDIFARFGGEEFSVILPETGLVEAVELASRVKNSVADRAATFEFSGKTVHHHQTISIGVATLDLDEFDIKKLIQTADERLYKAKQNGRNRVEYES